MNIKLLIYLVLSIVILASFSQHQAEPDVLIFTGGKDIDRTSFLKMFDEMENIEYEEIVQPEANEIYSSAAVDDFSVFVFYDMVQEINDAQKQAFLDILNKGKGILFLHHALVSYQDWEEYERIIGGRYYESTNPEDRIKYKQSTYRHGVNIPVEIINKDHPVTRGLNDFVIHDEVYGSYKVMPGVEPLLKTTHPESEKIIAWTHKYGRSRIVYLQLGHDHHAFNDSNYRVLVKQSLEWLMQE